MILTDFVVEVPVVLFIVNIRAKKVVVVIVLLTARVFEALVSEDAWDHVSVEQLAARVIEANAPLLV